jgi:biotin carboxylase
MAVFIASDVFAQEVEAGVDQESIVDDRERAASQMKLALIRRFLELNGTQAAIDDGTFLDRYADSSPVLIEAVEGGGGSTTLRDRLVRPIEALRRAYLPHRGEYQAAFEAHVNGEFTEDELREIVGFLETDTGQHFIEGRWRMDAYTQTSMEEITEEIIVQAAQELRSGQ